MLNDLARLIPAGHERIVMSQTTSSAKKRGPGGLLIVLIVLVVGAGAGVGAFWWGRRAAPVADSPHVRSGERGIVSFEPFVVNLADKNASRFLRTTVEVVVSDQAVAEQLQKTPVLLMQARSAILELLTLQTADALNTPEGKAALKKAIAEKLSSPIHRRQGARCPLLRLCHPVLSPVPAECWATSSPIRSARCSTCAARWISSSARAR